MNGISRIVLDTNVLLSALIFGGRPRQIVEMLAKAEIEVVVSEEILTEMRRKIAQKFPDFVQEASMMELLLEQDAESAKLGSLTISICRDPDDNRILETAVLGSCQYIVTGDKDLLALRTYNTIEILTPAQFLELSEKNK